MDAIMKKMRQKQAPFDDQSGDSVDPSELALEDDDPFSSSGFTGKLTFAGGDADSAKDINASDAGDVLKSF